MVICKYKDKCLDYPNMCNTCKYNQDNKDHYYEPKMPNIHYHLTTPYDINQDKLHYFEDKK